MIATKFLFIYWISIGGAVATGDTEFNDMTACNRARSALLQSAVPGPNGVTVTIRATNCLPKDH